MKPFEIFFGVRDDKGYKPVHNFFALFKHLLALAGYGLGTLFENHEARWGFALGFFLIGGFVQFGSYARRVNADALKLFNGLLAILHLVSGIAFTLLTHSSGDTWDVHVTLPRTRWNRYNTTQPNATVDDNARCDDPHIACNIDADPCKWGTVNIETMVLVFHLMSVMHHLVAALDGSVTHIYSYIDHVEKGNHYVRWLEYFASASLMQVCFALLCSITDMYTLVCVAGGIATTMMFGYMSDNVAQNGYNQVQDTEDKVMLTSDISNTTLRFGDTSPSPTVQTSPITSSPSSSIHKNMHAWGVFAMGFVPYLWVGWVAVVWAFVDTISVGGVNVDPPDELYAIIVTQFVFFTSFAVVQFCRLLVDPSEDNLRQIEWFFCILSLTAKTALAWSLFWGAQGRLRLDIMAAWRNQTVC